LPDINSINKSLKKVVIHTDGGCHGNPGPGGWAATLEFGKHKRELSGGVTATTNNRMELQAAIEALSVLKESCDVELNTDSTYVKNGVLSWISGWKLNGWRTKAKKPVKNEDLWRQLDSETSRHTISWQWLKGHAGHEGNEQCDELATKAIEAIKESHSPEQLLEALEEFKSNDAVLPPQPEFEID
jgi:ribonuclease HI